MLKFGWTNEYIQYCRLHTSDTNIYLVKNVRKRCNFKFYQSKQLQVYSRTASIFVPKWQEMKIWLRIVSFNSGFRNFLNCKALKERPCDFTTWLASSPHPTQTRF